jgi:hypothetical protein
MIIEVKGWQSSGKGLVTVACDLHHLRFDGYSPDEVYVNYKLLIPGVHCLKNQDMVQFCTDMVKKGYKHKLINITEADRVFPARYWQKIAQTEALLGMWQDEKLFNIVYYDVHAGTGVDVNLRNVRQMAMLPKYDKFHDLVNIHVINGLYGTEYDLVLPNVSKNIFPKYDRWEVID